MGRLADRVAIVTGAAAGIGRAIARRFAAEGAAVLAVDRNAEGLEATVPGITGEGGRTRALVEDVGAPGAADRIARACLQASGRIDVLVNNAGIGGSHEVLETSDEEWARILDVDLTSVFRLSRRVLVEMRRQGGGRIINMASVFGTTAFPGAASYSAAKAGVIALTKVMGKELAESGVLVNCVAPAAIETDIFAQMTPDHVRFMLSKIPMGRFGRKEELAAMVAWLASPDCSFSTGAVFDLSGGRATY